MSNDGYASADADAPRSGTSRRTVAVVAGLIVLSGFTGVGFAATEPLANRVVKPPGRPLRGADLFQVTNLFHVHLSGFGPGTFLGPAFLAAMDADESGGVTASEFQAAMGAWFTGWDTEPDDRLTDVELRAGIDKELGPSRFRVPAFGPPPGGIEPR